MAAERLVVGVIGAGGNTRLRHIPELLKIEGVEIKTVANRTQASAAAVASQFDIPCATGDWREVLADPDIDAVVIGTWPYMHRQLTVAALEAGKHVLCEARMAMDAAEARAMLAAARARPHLVAQLVPSPFTLPYDAAVQDVIRSGQLGDLVAIRVRGVGPAFPDAPGAPLSWRQNAKYSGLNVLTMGIAYEALARWVGCATRVMAMAKTVVKVREDGEGGVLVGVAVPDHVDVLAEMACGAQAHLTFSAVCGGTPGPEHEFWLHGTRGTLRLDADTGRVEVAAAGEGGGALHPLAVDPARRGGWRVEEEFVGAIRGTEAVRLTTLEAGVGYMEFTEAVARSAATGRAVALPLLV